MNIGRVIGFCGVSNFLSKVKPADNNLDLQIASLNTISNQDTSNLSESDKVSFENGKTHVIKKAEVLLDKLKRVRKLLSIAALFFKFAQNRVERIDKFMAAYEVIAAPKDAASALERFQRRDMKSLSIKINPKGSECDVLKEVSTRFFSDSKNDYSKFKDHMFKFYKGENFVFVEFNEEEPFKLYKDLSNHGYLRGSSHYDHGTTNYKTGGPVPKDKGEVDNPQYGFDGDHIKHLCFGRAVLLADEHRIYFGKTEQEVIDLTGKNKDEFKQIKVTWIQTEGAPDSDNPFTKNFWRHRVRDFTLYIFRKNILRSKTPNVGPYGYGHGDTNPTLISA